MSNIIMITGATSGFGKAIAETFAAAGWNLIITGRRKERLESLQHQLVKKYGIDILPLNFDVRVEEEVNAQLNHLPKKWTKINVLVNNAGLALGSDSIDKGNTDDWNTMIDTNIKGLLYVSKCITPYFIRQKKGHIINIASTAGKDVYPGGNVYCATKHAVLALTEAQRIDLLPYSIKATSIDPGAADTEFSLVRYKGDKDKADKVYKGYKALTAKDVANIIFFAATLPPHVCINDLVVTCTAQANALFVNKNE